MPPTAFLPAPLQSRPPLRRPRPAIRVCPRCVTEPPPRRKPVSRRAFLFLAASATLVAATDRAEARLHPHPDFELTPPASTDSPPWVGTQPDMRMDQYNNPLNEKLPTSGDELDSELDRIATLEDYRRVQIVPPTDFKAEIEEVLRTALLAGFHVAGVYTSVAVSSRLSDRMELPVHYDLSALQRYFFVRPDKLARRVALFASEASIYGAGWLADRVITSFDNTAVFLRLRRRMWARNRADKRTDRRAVALRDGITRLGPAMIKLGQAAASRPDLFPAPLVRELQRLQDDVSLASPAESVLAVVESEVNAPVKTIFDEIDPNPVAGASLGMVFKAVLDGRPVAVKVQRPNVAENIALDCYILRSAAEVATTVFSLRTDWRAAVDEYATRLFEELDYTNEVKNMTKFRDMYGQVEGIYLPRVFPQYCTRRVLVTEWVEGEKLIDDDARVRGEDLSVVKTGIRFALMQLLERGFLHADMHNGNMLKTKSGYLAFIDFGLVSEVPVTVRESIVCALLHLMHGDYALLAESFGGLAIMRSDQVEVDLPVLTEALREAFAPPTENEHPRDFSLIGVTGKLLSLGTRFPLVFSDYFLNNLRCLAMLEGLALNADPSFRVVSVVYPYVVQRVLSGSSNRFRAAVDGLAFDSYGRVRWTRIERLLVEEQAVSGHPEYAHSIDPGDNGLQIRSADLLLRFLNSENGGFLRSVVLRRYMARVQKRWQRRIDSAFGEDAPVSKRTVRRELDDVEARGTAAALLSRVPLSRRLRVLARLAPSALAAVLRMAAALAAYALARMVLAVTVFAQATAANKRKTAAAAATTVRNATRERFARGAAAAAGGGTERWTIGEPLNNENDEWRAFESTFAQRTRNARLTGRSVG